MSRFAPSDLVARLIVADSLVVLGLILVAAVVGRLALRPRPAARHGLWLATLGLVIASPLLVAAFDHSQAARWTIRLARPENPVALPPPPPQIPPLPLEPPSTAPREIDPPVLAAQPVPIEPPPLIAPEAPRPVPRMPIELESLPASPWTRADWLGLAVLVWLTGLALGLGRLALGYRALRSLRPSLHAVDPAAHAEAWNQVRAALGVAELPPVFTSSRVAGPIAAGLVRPFVVVPVGLTEHELRDVLIHECAHILRRDLWVGLLQRLVGVVAWPHLPVHYLNHQLSRAREEVCDNFVLHGGDPRGYARTLLALTERRPQSSRLHPTLGIVGSTWTLADRVAGLLSPERNQMIRSSLRFRFALGVLLLGVSLPLAALRFDPPPAQAAEATTLDFDLLTGPDRPVTGIVVDEAGQPVQGAIVRPIRPSAATDGATTGEGGTFSLILRGSYPRPGEDLLAEAEGGTRLGLGLFQDAPTTALAPPVRIVLKPSRVVTVRVRNGDGQAVAGAAVEAADYFYHQAGQTSLDGKATLRIPADAPVRWVHAHKSGVGYDYFENFRTEGLDSRDLAPLPADLTLKLDGASTVRIMAVDSTGQPVAGVKLAPWTIRNWGKLDRAIVAGSLTGAVTTGADGVATFDWLPKHFESDIPFIALLGDYSCPDGPIYIRTKATELTAPVLRNTAISGVVRTADGQPARNVLILVEGRGDPRMQNFRQYTRTGADGRYSIAVNPSQTYIIAVVDQTLAARSLTGITVREGQPQAGMDLTLVPGTLVQGLATRGLDRTPVPGVQLELIQDGAVQLGTAAGAIGAISVTGSTRVSQDGAANLEGTNIPVGGTFGEQKLVRYGTTDADGRYQFRIGPGRFEVLVPGDVKAWESLTVSNPDAATVTRNLQLTERERHPFAGQVVELVPGGSRPVVGALVEARGTWPNSGQFTVRTDAEGRFQGTRGGGGPFVVYAQSNDGKLAGFTIVPAAANDGVATVAPAATVSGRVVDAAGLTRGGSRVSVQLNDPSGSASMPFYLSLRTGERGRFTFSGVPVGAHGQVTTGSEDIKRRPWWVTQTFDVPNAGPVELPDLAIPPDPDGQAGPARVAGPAPRRLAPTVTSRTEVEDLIRLVGRDPVTPELVDRVGIGFRSQNVWTIDLDQTRRLVTERDFAARIDALARAQQLPRPDTAMVVWLASRHKRGMDAAWLEDRLKFVLAARQRPVVMVTGTVDDPATGRPLAGARVMTDADLTRTDAQGRFTLPTHPEPDSKNEFWVEADDFALRKLSLDAIDRAPQAIHLVRSVPVEGQVLDPAGQPIAGASVQVQVRMEAVLGQPLPPRDAGGMLQMIAARSNDQGWFSIPGVPAFEESVMLQVSHPDCQDGYSQAIASNSAPVVVRLAPGAVVSGVVVDEGGRWVAGASVGLFMPGSDGTSGSAITDSRGRYRFGNVKPGRWDLLIESEQFAPVLVPVVADLDAPVANQVVVVPGGSIRGRVVDAAGQPVAGAKIRWVQSINQPHPSLSLEVTTETDGSFKLGPLPPGEFRFTGSSPSGPPYTQGKTTARTNQTDALIRLTSDPVSYAPER